MKGIQMATNNTDNLEDKVDLVKHVAALTLQRLAEVEKTINDLQAMRASLKRDCADLKEGRLDRIEERHKIDQASKDHAVFTVEKNVVVGRLDANPWYYPFIISTRNTKGKFEAHVSLEINNSITKINAPGSYKMPNGEVRFL